MYTNLPKCSLGEQMTLDSRQRFVRIVVGLFDQPELLSLTLVQPGLDAVRLLQPLEGQDEQLSVVFVRERREWNGSETSGLQPVHGSGVDRDGFLGRYVRSILRKKKSEGQMNCSQHGKTAKLLSNAKLDAG